MQTSSKNIVQIGLILGCLFMTGTMQAQKKRARAVNGNDTLQVLREFIQISNQYQQVPLYLELTLTNTTNFITSEGDTGITNAVFYLTKNSSYTRFGDAEQLTNDSIALLVNDKMQRMIVFSNARPVMAGLRSLIGGQGKDSSVLELAKKFSAQILPPQQNTQAIRLASRDLLYTTTIPKETIELQYDMAAREPVRVVTTKRSLYPVEEDVYKQLQTRDDMAGKLLTIDTSRFYVVKEQQGSFDYKKITHEANMHFPAVIADRITRNEEGEFIPLKQYEQYAITIN
ncbi:MULTISPECIES: hypothetical protein [Niastella]|uniref:DUF4292 domain-containing protein n=1 Tax=Niastella soli TaxID=2821487 RepID=A0ABS3Z514_9BACT|nr:hypothetical protein [Niastella soli]MBO9205233.1 hypothetical protein [Niastella soli]